MKKIFIVGGSGFVGQHICKEAIKKNWQVISLSRRGPPMDYEKDALLRRVTWQTGNVSDPDSYATLLQDCDTVIHSMGILFENQNLQHFLLSPIRTISNFYQSNNVLNQENVSFLQANRDSARILAAQSSLHKSVKVFCYLSANHSVPPFLPSGYLQAKKEAETILLDYPFSSLIFRPGVMYSSEGLFGYPTATLLKIVGSLPLLPSLFPWAFVELLPVQLVAKSIINAIEMADTFNQKQTVFEIEKIKSFSTI